MIQSNMKRYCANGDRVHFKYCVWDVETCYSPLTVLMVKEHGKQMITAVNANAEVDFSCEAALGKIFHPLEHSNEHVSKDLQQQ